MYYDNGKVGNLSNDGKSIVNTSISFLIERKH